MDEEDLEKLIYTATGFKVLTRCQSRHDLQRKPRVVQLHDEMEEAAAPRAMSVAGPSTAFATTLQSSSLHLRRGVSRRKFSFPAALHSTLLGLHDPTHENDTATASARRRFSNVSDAVSRKLSHTIGQWRGSTVSTVSIREVAEQGRSLCAQYVRNRLKRSGLFSRKCGLQRLRSATNLPGGYVVSEVAPHLLRLGHELERMHPKLFSSVCRQVCVTLTPEKTARSVLSRVGHELFKVREGLTFFSPTQRGTTRTVKE